MDPGVQSRLKGRFDQVASTYAANRPDYPATAAGWLLGGQVSDVLDLAAGSGSLTRALAARASRVVAAEPARNLLRELRRSDPRIPAARANAEQLPFGAGTFAVVTVATAFHWFHHSRALPEIARVLRGGGHLGLVWNTRTVDTPWTRELDTLMRSAQPLQGNWGTDSVRALEASPLFERPAYAEFPHAQLLDRDGLVGLVSTRSYVIALDEQPRQRLLTEVAELFDAAAGGRDTVEMPYRTQCWRSTVRRT